MKKILVMAALAICSFANAQKGTILVGGNIGYSSETVDYTNSETKNNQFSFSPKVGYQFHDNWTVGGEFTVASSKNDQGVNEYKTNDFKLGAFVRYSVPLNQTFSVFADLGAGFQNRKEKDYVGANYTKYKADGMYVGITPALFINMKKGFGLNFSIGGLGYDTLSYDNNGPDVSNFYFNFGQTFNIGISKNF
ncbi:Outer membrane protein beta-barrel domain-containing protein [Flavobacterium sp. CF108]|uniref:outer membrane beta-barrel protein n=1 Tax=unclassified Flavobacterium TaxID=196869 RepID=UPI0008C2A3A7|nr:MULTISPECIES: outer membrane beta-barrel protein [unclassified Flavobacterium]SEN45870.1 Outer membrane protein beta-barrel domain-containing protein [Flavobacterium sp. fv08]SHG93290.1 Outer membrane protein beta-barrel domain-containing protein [Flavobacterium sp. CF108]